MAGQSIFLDAIDEFYADKDAVETFVNGDENTDVNTRLNATYPSLKKAVAEILRRGGIADRFKTLSDLQASDLTDGQYALVADDTGDNNGIYIKEGGEWVKSKYDVLSYLNKFINKLTKVEISPNLFNPETVKNNSLINNNGLIQSADGWSRSDFIPVVGGETYTISGSNRRSGISFFTEKSNLGYIEGSFNPYRDPLTVTAPVNAQFLVINIQQPNSAQPENIQVEQGELTSYAPFGKTYTVKKDQLPSDSVYQEDLNELKQPKKYEIFLESKNLFNPNDIKRGAYLFASSSNPSALGSWKIASEPSEGWDNSDSTLKDWYTSGAIPVEGGKTYTLSGYRSKQGLSIFDENGFYGSNVLCYLVENDLPITFTTPENAAYIVFNLQSPYEQPNGWDSIQLEEGDIATTYITYGETINKIDEDYIEYKKTIDENKPNLKPIGEGYDIEINAKPLTLSVRTGFSPEALKQEYYVHERANVFNFLKDEYDNEILRTPTDDAAPLRADNYTIAANHGFAQSFVTSENHGKTDDDVGSIWSDGSNYWILIRIRSSNSIAFINRDSNASLDSDTTTLNHVSGAANTSSIDITEVIYNQLYPVIKNRNIEMTIDGKQTPLPLKQEMNYTENVVFHESYEVMSRQDIADWIVNNGGKKLTSYEADASILCNYSYTFDRTGGCVIYASINVIKDIPFSDWMVTQSSRQNYSGREYYVPKTTPFDGYNFTELTPLPSSISKSIWFNASNNEPDANPVDRIIQTASSDIAYATGYLPVFDAKPELREMNAGNKYLEIRNSSLKTYPRLVDGLKDPLQQGDNFAGVAYRKYFKRDIKRTAKYVVRSNVGDFLYLDWHTAKTDVIELEDDLVGREFEIHEKSSNVTLLSKFATNNIVVEVDSSKNYGYLVLRFDK